jgi:AraC family transcriptional regulator
MHSMMTHAGIGPGTTARMRQSANSQKRNQGLDPRAMARALRFIDEHLCDNFSLQDLADAACTSRFHFARQFRSSTGCSPMGFVLRARIEAGRQMLSRDEPRIAAVAVALGFFDQSHFTRAFRRVVGVPPRTYARQLCEPSENANAFARHAKEIAA